MVLIAMFFSHWIGDFVLQSDWMARNKSKSWRALTTHVVVYTLTLFTFGCALDLTRIPLPWEAAAFALTNGVVHFGVDAVTSRITSRLWAAGETHYFFVVIGFDQLLHAATLLVALRMFYGA